MSGKTVRLSAGPGGWGGPLVIRVNEKKNKILCITAGGGIHPVAQKIAEMTGAQAIDGYKNNVPDEEVLAVVVDCGGTARCGVYPKKGIYTVNLNPVGAVGPLATFMKEDIYVSGVTKDQITYEEEEEIKAQKPEDEERLSSGENTSKNDKFSLKENRFGMENISKIGEEENKHGLDRERGVENQTSDKKENLVTRIGITIGYVVNKFFAAGRDAIDICIKTILPFMAFTATLLGIISESGLGNLIAKTVAPLCNTLPGMLAISIVCAIPILSPILGPGAVIAQTVGILLGSQIGDGNIKAQYALPALFAIDAQVGCDFIPVGLSLGEAESDTISFGTPAVLYSRLITGPLSVIIAFIFSIGLYA